MIRVVWYNINGIKGKAGDIIGMMETEDIDVMMLQEASNIDEELFKKLNTRLGRINCVLLCHTPNKHMATVIRTTKITSYGVVESEERLQVIKVESAGDSITLVNHYGSHKKDVEHYENLERCIGGHAIRGKLLFGGDHNAVTAASERTANRNDANTHLLNNVLNGNNLQDLNTAMGVEKYHTFFRKGSSSRIDSVWGNRAAVQQVQMIEMYTKNGVHSDHLPTMVTIKNEVRRSRSGGAEQAVRYIFPKNRADS